MPELPEVETLRLSLIPRLVGRTISAVRILRRDVIIGPGDPASGFSRSRTGARPRKLAPATLLVGAKLGEIRRVGKQLAIMADDGRTLCIHLGMSGQLRWAPGAPQRGQSHRHVVWRLDDGSSLVFRDPRRFGGVWAFATVQNLLESRWAALGHDALLIGAGDLARGLHGARRPLKAALLDQAVIAGVGNIYADEALFAARLSPTRPASELNTRETAALARAIRQVMATSIAAGGSSLRDYLDADGNPGQNQRRFKVYGRGGDPCIVCGQPLKVLHIAQRTTVMCPSCQG